MDWAVRSALCSACDKFVAKTQQALSSSIVAGLLLAIGYKVDSVTDAFIGDVAGIEILEEWLSGDARPGRGDEQWLNIILKKTDTASLRNQSG